jgi:hypothetical protein
MSAVPALPAWVVVPLDMNGAAAALGISRRTLVDVIAQHKHYEPRGNRKVFYPEHIASLRETLCQGSKSSSATELPTPPGPLVGSAYERALALATGSKRKSSAPPMKRASGNVLPMAKRPSEPSRRLP